MEFARRKKKRNVAMKPIRRAIPGHRKGDLLSGAKNRYTVATDIKVYFCDPQSPGSAAERKHENTNLLL